MRDKEKGEAISVVKQGNSPPAVHLNELAPDHVEEDDGEQFDDLIPSRGYELPHMVGLGGSAGSIPALNTFFKNMPDDSGMVFVVVLHLSPEHESSLAAVLQHSTRMPVVQVAEAVQVEPNHVYVIPPNRALLAADGFLRLTELHSERGKRVAVDLFFRTLGDSYGPHSTAVVLSGADGDGAIGIKRVKERGGLTLAQDPEEADHPGMPATAISTGMVDWVLPVAQMPANIKRYVEQEARLRLPSEATPRSPVQAASAADAEAALRDVLNLLRNRTGRDFSDYKRATIVRRISRRMQVNGVDDMVGYLNFLRTHPGEAGALLRDLLITVTNFFRDDKAFAALEARIPELFREKGPSDIVRVWVAACATGEEAYSVAILLAEHARRLDAPPQMQVFATDLDEEVIQVARSGTYPITIQTDVSKERLLRFFVREHNGYRVRREIRETVLFAQHDLLKDSPFSRLDLVTCRNLLIYLNRHAQSRALETFHFALNPGGRLFLGTSESVETESNLFSTLDKKHRIYAPRPIPRATPMIGPVTHTLAQATRLNHRKDGPVIPLSTYVPQMPLPLPDSRSDESEKRLGSWSELHFKLLERFGPPSIMVNHEHEIVHLSESSGRFLQFTGGEPTRNLLRLVHPMLRIELRAALYRATESGQATEAFSLPLDLDGTSYRVTIRVVPAADIAPDFFLVTFESRETRLLGDDGRPKPSEPDEVSQHLERELEGMKSHLLEMVEQYEASTEELKASNEELQAMNEELRSATEELETSREELQSINEELTTVNFELKNNVEELGDANSDLHNLMGASAIATVFLDRDLRITRFTPSAVGLFNLISTDIGRPLTDLQHHFDYPRLETDALDVLKRLVPIEREIGEQGGGWFLARWLPYRTLEDRIAGVVLTLVDITERRRTEKALEQSRVELLAALRDTEKARAVAESTMRAKDQFMAVLSHELRTPLTPVMMAARLIEREVDLTPRAQDLVSMIQRNVEIETRLIDELLDVTRIAHGKLQVNREPMDLHDAINAAIQVAHQDVLTKRQRLTVELGAGNSRVDGDHGRLQQALWNLLKNASKFTPPNGEVRVRSTSDTHRIIVTVSDDGIGIASGMLAEIFEAFKQGNELSHEYGGLGLGLAISRSIVEQHGGRISAASDGSGKGATFTVELPLLTDPGEE